ncbi:MAG: sigma-54-dependent Fis family transcriptional regulator [Calditrichaeota bacterium]|nr:MAG: sigma-54-dependent Fis family transcriptional regulator [Calditrichota bacterium]
MVLLNKYRKIQSELGIIGKSEQIRELIELVISVAPTDISVLITGESGTGKEVFAKAIHKLSPRRNGPMISVNCGAIPEGLLESELFGHERGAFTGAVATKKGYFELADRGTIFLDEIGEMPIQTQVKLLRVLETGEFMRVGSGDVRKVDVRVIAATNRDLAEMVRQGTFRKDLYYRLKAVSLHIPPLRERKEDIPLLIEHFMKEVTNRSEIEFAGFTEEAMEVLINYPWPGNVRELKNFIETIVILSRGEKVTAEMVREHLSHYELPESEENAALPMPTGKSVERAERELIYKALVSLGVEMREIKDLLYQITDRLNGRFSEGVVVTPATVVEEDEIKPMDQVEREMIEKALEKFHGNRRQAARALNISERTLYRKIKEYNLDV